MQYTSTRDHKMRVSAADAIITGLAPDGGLFVPAEVPTLDIRTLANKPYAEVALGVLKVFLPQYSEEFLRTALAKSYGDNFGGKAGEIVKLSEDLYSLELWHGPTAAFKDYALQLTPKLLVEAKRIVGQTDETIVLVATSGDTGTAALQGFVDIPGIKIAVFYPDKGTSEIQRLQMVTQQGGNVAVYAVVGNFDDTQRGVKLAFNDKQLAELLARRGKKLSSANSINWGRLVPQIVYYTTSYLKLCAQGTVSFGQPVDFCVPTGNFGDIMAGYYAKWLGVPVGKLICAANQNNVLVDFINTGVYNSKRNFYKTSSPSMDILVSSNLERLLYHTSGSDEEVRFWMRQLAEEGAYKVNEATLKAVGETFAAGWAGEDAVSEEISQMYRKHGYLCDPHTAVAFRVLREMRKQNPVTPTVVLSTANPFKFCGKVLSALGQAVPAGEFDALRALEAFSGQKAPDSLRSLGDKPIRFTEVIEASSILEIPMEL